ncbi:hypothetical protein QQS21_011296 [Conoideocrella luteorostrata]|uniref:Uncharacterized protein n=1 Tax=Conoideocrella luteorostrata TaxID=1105319 RepID=A0AAJ0CFP3_9HYPO|nr:hypothetical protein QQS21_011296 [Conoideocrella luteorostrata]
MDNIASRWLEPALGDLYTRLPQLNASPDGFGSPPNSSSAFINSLRFQASKSIRTSFLILASFNAMAGAATAAGIYWDCYMNSRRNDPDFRFRSSFWRLIGPAETFPFVLSLSIVVQGMIFAVVQSFGLQSSLILGCTPLSQIMLPAFFIVPYIQFTFGLEAIFQAVRPYQPFSRRYKWSLPICLAVSVLGLIGTYVLTRFVLPPNFCFASLFFFLRRWGIGCFGMVIGIASTLLMGSLVTVYRLYQVSGIGEQQRITASWMAWFMALGAVMMSIMVPYFYSVSADDGSKVSTLQSQLSMAGVVVANLTGLNNGALYVLLRSSRLGKIGPKGYHEFDSRRSVRRPGTTKPLSFVFTKQIQQPVPMPAKLPERRVSSYYPPLDMESAAAVAEASNGIGVQVTDASNQPSAVGIATTTNTNTWQHHTRKNSYNLFPRDTTPDLKSMYLLPATAYAPSSKEKTNNPFADELPAPPTLRLAGGKHTRDSSVGSSATVPIGLRVSNINDLPPVQSFYQIPRTSTSGQRTRPESTVPVPPIPSSLIIPDGDDAKERKDKQLPPVPLAVTKKANDEELRLSPTVYSPQRKSPTSKGTRSISPGTSPPPRPNWITENPSRVKEAQWI